MLDRPLPRSGESLRRCTIGGHPLHPGRVPPHGGVRHRHHRAGPGGRRRAAAAARPSRAIYLLQPRGRRPLARARRPHAGGRDDAALHPVARAAGAGPGRRPGWPTSSRRTTTATTAASRPARKFLEAQDGAEQAELLTVLNPRAILERRAAHSGAAGRDPAELDAADPPAARGRRMTPAGIKAGLEALARSVLDSVALSERVAAVGRPLRRDAARRGARSSSAATAAARPTPSTSPPNTWCATRRRRRPLAAIALTTDSSLLTAAANDLGFEQVFARQVEALCRPEDLLVLHSTSGESPNLLAAAARRARALGADRRVPRPRRRRAGGAGGRGDRGARRTTPAGSR